MAALKSSKQRDAILQELQGRYDHPTAETLYLDLKQQMPQLSLATVYRNLKVLEREGLVMRILAQDAEHFDGNFQNHYHMTCQKCSKIMDLELNGSEVIDRLPTRFGGEIKSHTLMYFGVCPDCSKS